MRNFFVESIAKLLTALIPVKSVKRRYRDKIKTFIFGYEIISNAKSIGNDFVCSGWSYCGKNTIIKDNVRINGLKHEGLGTLTIGNYCQFGKDVHIITQNHDYDTANVIPYGVNDTIKDVEIGDFCWIGSGAYILPGAKIGEGAIIQAGAVVHGEIPPCAIAGGNPAKVFKYRDIDHYNELKAKGAFLNYYQY